MTIARAFRRPGAVRTGLVFGAVLAVYVVATGLRNTVYNNHVLLADAFLHGRVWIPSQPPGIDAILYRGHWYIIEGPLPAVLMLPLVAIMGTAAPQTFVAAICGAVAVAAAYVTFGRMGLGETQRLWLTAFLAFGTVLFWSTAFSAVWMFAHVVGVMFAMLAVAEWYGRRRPALLGFLISCAALTRFPMVLAALPLGAALAAQTPRDLRRLEQFVLGAAPLFVLYAGYNYARWHTLGDIGYTLWYHQDQVGEPTGSPFRLRYLPFNLYSFFFLPPQFLDGFPWLKPTSYGVALTFTSPALALAFLADARQRESLLWWSATLLTALPSLLYYVNGFEQFGMRHSLDFTPFLLPLVARGLQRYPTVFAYALIALSIAASSYGVWYSWAYHGFSVVPR